SAPSRIGRNCEIVRLPALAPAQQPPAFGTGPRGVESAERLDFLKVDQWQPVLLDAVELFCSLFDATDCIITNDEHPAIVAMGRGSVFAASIDDASGRGGGEVATVKEMFIDKGFAEDLVYQNPDGTHSEIPLWDAKGLWRPDRRRARTS